MVYPVNQKIAYPLSFYLTTTEKNKNMRHFFETVSWAADLDDSMAKPRRLDLKKICDLYAKTKALKD